MSDSLLMGAFVTYIGSSLAIFLLIARLTRTTEQDAAQLFFLTLGLGPITISWLLAKFFCIFPHNSDLFYITLVSACFIIPVFFCRKQLSLLKYLCRQAEEAFNGFQFNKRRLEAAIILAVSIIMLIVFLQCIVKLAVGNDFLKYATVSRLLYEYKMTSVYPFINGDPAGFVSASPHPLGYHMLMVWSYMLQGNNSSPGMIRTIAPFYTLCSIILLYYLLSRKGVGFGAFGMLVFISTPLIVNNTLDCHVDPMRVYFFFLAFTWLSVAIDKGELRNYITAGFATGMSMYCHAIGFLTLPFLLFTYYFISEKTSRQKISALVIIAAVALLIGGQRPIINCQLYGSPTGSVGKVRAMKELHHIEWVKYTRQINTFNDRIIYGLLKGFSKRKSFGLSYFVLLLALIVCFKQFRTNTRDLTFLYVMLLFYALVVVSLLLNKDDIIKNDRYFLTLQPFVAYLAAVLLGNLYEKVRSS